MHLTVDNYALSPQKYIAGTAGSYGFETVTAEFSTEWADLDKKIIFYPDGGKPVSVLLTGTAIPIPAEALARPGVCKYAVVGYDGEKILISVPGEIIVLGTLCPDGEPSVVPTPSETEQFFTMMEETSEIAQSVRDDADNGEFDGCGIASIVRTSGDGSPGSTDVYTITLDDGRTSTFTVYNGKDLPADREAELELLLDSAVSRNAADAVAENSDCLVSGSNAHAEGYRTEANGTASHAEGNGCIASGDCSHAGGKGTVASREAQTAVGSFNTESTEALFLVGDGTDTQNRRNAFEIISRTVDGARVASVKIGSMELDETGIKSGNLADGSIICAKIADGAVTTGKIGGKAVTSDKIADGTVTAAKIADGNITAGKIANNAITTAKIADENVTSVKIADNAVTTGKLADGAVTPAKASADFLTRYPQSLTEAEQKNVRKNTDAANALYRIVTENGKSVILNRPDWIKELTVTGYTEQGGSPTPENPVDIDNTGNLAATGEHAGEYAVPIQVRGKNLFDLGNYDAISDFDNDGYNVTVAYPAGVYTLSYDKPISNGVGIRVYQGTTLLATPATVGNKVTCTFTADSQWRLRAYKDGAANAIQCLTVYTNLLKEIQIESGSAVTVYEPYQTPDMKTVYLTSPLRNGDTMNAVSGTVTRNRARKVFDGTEAWDKNAGANYYRVTAQSIGAKESGNILNCTHFTQGNIGTIGNVDIGTFLNFHPADAITSTAEWKAYLVAQYAAGTPVTVEYDLATPNAETVSGVELFTVSGTNILSVKTETPPSGISAEYAADLNVIFSELNGKIAELTAAIAALGTT